MKWNEQDIEWIIQHLKEPASLVTKEFQHWLETGENRQKFEMVLRYREAFLRKEDSGHIDVNVEFQRLAGRMAGRHRKVHLWKWAVAASVVVCVGIGALMLGRNADSGTGKVKPELVGRRMAELVLANGDKVRLGETNVELQEQDGTHILNDTNSNLVYKQTQETTNEIVYNTLRVPAGADYIVRLADGSSVHLNSESTFRYPVAFAGKERRVYLEGEAYFEVAKSEACPFIVVTDVMDVRVTGTSFNVQAYRDRGTAATTLVNGSVTIQAGENKTEAVPLTPNHQLRLDKESGKVEVREVDVSLYTGWTEGMFVFKNERLEDVMAVLAKWHRVDVFYANQSVKDLRISANLPRYEHIDTLLQIIRAMDKIQIECKGNTLTIR